MAARKVATTIVRATSWRRAFSHFPFDSLPPTSQYMLEAIGAGSQKRVGNRAWSDIYRDSELFQENLRTIAELKKEALAQPDNHEVVKEYATSFPFQLKTVLNRTLTASWRSPGSFSRLERRASKSRLKSLMLTSLLFPFSPLDRFQITNSPDSSNTVPSLWSLLSSFYNSETLSLLCNTVSLESSSVSQREWLRSSVSYRRIY